MTDTVWVSQYSGPRRHARRRGRPPASDSAVTRERIVRAARKVFADAGFGAATFQAIAAEIGLTRPAINNYFPNKAVLYAEVVDRVSSAVLDAIRTASSAPTLADQVTEFLRMTVRGDENEPALVAFLVHAALEASHLPDSDAAATAPELVERFIRDAVDAAVRRGEVPSGRDARELADTLVGLVWGTALQLSRGCRRGGGAQTDRMLGRLGTLLDRGLRPAG